MENFILHRAAVAKEDFDFIGSRPDAAGQVCGVRVNLLLYFSRMFRYNGARESGHPDFGTLSPRALRPVHEIVLLICDVVADMARYVTGENCGGKAVPVGQAILPLPYGEKKGSKRNCFLQPEKYFFGLAVALKIAA